MRTATGGEVTAIQSSRPDHYLKVEVKDSDGTWRNCSSLEGTDWVDSCTIVTEQIDQPVAQATVYFRRDISTAANKSLAPLMTASTINKDALLAYAPLLDAGRSIRISVAVMAHGASPSGSDYKELFFGRIDRVAWEGDPISVACSDLSAWLMDTQIETENEYGSDGGTAVETVISAILAAWPSGVYVPTLYVPSSPGWLLHRYKQDRVKVFEAARALAQQIGWDLRHRYDASDTLRFWLWEPDRAKTSPDATITPAQYTDVRNLNLAIDNIRNVCKVVYTVAGGTTKSSQTASDAGSIAHFGRRYMEIEEASTSNIDTSGEASDLAAAIVHDLAAPEAEQEIDMLLDWRIQFGDLLRFSANGVHYDSDQDLAVVGVRHEFRNATGTTSVTVRGSVAGAYQDWLKRQRVNTEVMPEIMSAAASFQRDGSVKISLVGNSLTGSMKYAVSTSAYPSDATTRAATTREGRTFDATEAGPYALTDTIFLTAYAYAGAGATGVESKKFMAKLTREIIQPTLRVEITQLTSAEAAVDPTTSFKIKVVDPTGIATSATVTLDYQGIQSMVNNTLGGAAGNFTATIGTEYTFTATLNRAFRGGGYAKFVASAANLANGYATWWSASASQDTAPSCVISIRSNTSSSDTTAKADAFINAGNNIGSIKYVASTSGFTSQATVAASGTTVSGGSPFTITDLGVNLALGDSVYLSYITLDSFGVVTGYKFDVKATRSNLAATKTATFAAYGTLTSFQTNGVDYAIASSDSAYKNIGGNSSVFEGTFTLPPGCTVTKIECEIWQSVWASGISAAESSGDVYVNGGASLGHLSTTSTSAAWVTLSITVSQTTTNARFQISHLLVDASTSTSDTERVRSYTITYLPASLQTVY